MANLDGCNVYKNGIYKETYFYNGKETYFGSMSAVEVCFLAFLEYLESSAPLELMFAHGSQFGRLSISGTATRIGVDITAGWQYGGGLYISGTATLTNTNVYENQAERFGGGLYVYGTATLTNTNVYDNQATTVCSPLNFP